MAIIPDFKLYQSDGVTLAYTFPNVHSTNMPYTSAKKSIVISNIRGKGCIIYDGGTDNWEIVLEGVITGDDYEDLTDNIDAMESAVSLQTAFVLKLDKDASTAYSYNVKRIHPIEYLSDGYRTNYQKYRVRLIANAW